MYLVKGKQEALASLIFERLEAERMKESNETKKNKINHYLDRLIYLNKINGKQHDYTKAIKQYKEAIKKIVDEL